MSNVNCIERENLQIRSSESSFASTVTSLMGIIANLVLSVQSYNTKKSNTVNLTRTSRCFSTSLRTVRPKGRGNFHPWKRRTIMIRPRVLFYKVNAAPLSYKLTRIVVKTTDFDLSLTSIFIKSKTKLLYSNSSL